MKMVNETESDKMVVRCLTQPTRVTGHAHVLVIYVAVYAAFSLLQ